MSAKGPMRAIPKTASISVEEVWRRGAERLRVGLGEDVFNSWFGGLRLEEFISGRARFSVSTRFLKSWIEAHYQEKLFSALAAELDGVIAVEIHVRSNQPSPVRLADTQSTAAPNDAARPTLLAAKRLSAGEARAQLGSPLDRRLTFATFIAGRANELALSLARKLSDEPGAPTPPLFFHSAVGLGKTHLLQAIAHAGIARRQSVAYLTAETFMYGFVNALRSQAAIAFKEHLRSIDLLIFDDAQFLQGRVIQNEFGHALNALIDAGRKVVIAADRPPSELDAVDERVRSRLAGGICVEMRGLDEGLRLKILEARLAAAKLAHPSLVVPHEVLLFVATAVASNGRDLEGAINRLVAHAQLAGQPMTVAAAEAAVRDLIRSREPKRVKIEDIQKRVATHYNVSRADLLSSRRTAAVVMPRQIAMYLAKSLTLRSLPEIGRRFGGRDHTTVLHAVRKIDNLCNNDAALREEIDLLKRLLQE
ncbi:MAG TPA: chromosomal replication initiator protein DnaA [Roseiarcus sp.]|nr:chromosomal replication initiator protein DnaA [Roseiarcus sp.]